jgi:hypothetical protein
MGDNESVVAKFGGFGQTKLVSKHYQPPKMSKRLTVGTPHSGHFVPLGVLFTEFGDIYESDPPFGLEEALDDIRDACAKGEVAELAISVLDEAVARLSQQAKIVSRARKCGLLSVEELTCLRLYTDEFLGGHSLYQVLNSKLQGGDRNLVKPFVRYTWLLLNVMTKCNAATCRTVYRGVRDIDISAQYKKGTEFEWHGFTSATSDLGVQNRFTGTAGVRNLFHIDLATKRGRDISEFSAFPDECEILFPPNTKFRVTGQVDLGNGLTMIHVEERPPTDPSIVFKAVRPVMFGLSFKDVAEEPEEILAFNSSFSLPTTAQPESPKPSTLSSKHSSVRRSSSKSRGSISGLMASIFGAGIVNTADEPYCQASTRAPIQSF